MNAFAGKHEGTESESDRKRQNSESGLRVLSSIKREERQRLLIETIEQNEAPSIKTLYNLPLELLDMILQKSYLHWILNSSTNQRDEEVIRSLISVDACFYRRITRQRFKKAIWRYLKDFYGKTTNTSVIIRNNRNYLLENIQPNDELFASLLSLICITEEQSHFIQRQRLERDKSDELLYVLEPMDDAQWSNFVRCLRQTNQKTVARVIENGGVVIKMQVKTCIAKCTASMELHRLHQQIEDLRNRTKPWSHQTQKLINQLKEEDIEILNSQLDRQTVVVWIWCHSQTALEHIQSLYESNQLLDVFFENIQPYISMVINIDGNQFKRTVVTRPISINFTQRIQIGLHENEDVVGLTKLRNKIYVLNRSYAFTSFSHSPRVIRVFEDRNPFRPNKEIETKEIIFPKDMASSEKENCLYVSDSVVYCVWKITGETDDQHKIIKWLTTDYEPINLSVSTDGQLLIVNHSLSILMIYGSDAELLRFIQLPSDIVNPLHAVETSIGNFIIIDWCMAREEGDGGSSGREWPTMWSICELTRDGQMVIRRFSPSNETQKLYHPFYLSIDSDDRVFVADFGSSRVILLDSNLKWNRILCQITDEKEETKMHMTRRLCYEEENKQLIVAGFSVVDVYKLNRK